MLLYLRTSKTDGSGIEATPNKPDAVELDNKNHTWIQQRISHDFGEKWTRQYSGPNFYLGVYDTKDSNQMITMVADTSYFAKELATRSSR
jgi:hypothetical protein